MSSDDELPLDPDLDDLPDEIEQAEGPLTLTGTDEDGNVWTGPVTKDDLARGFADRRRVDDSTGDSTTPTRFRRKRGLMRSVGSAASRRPA